MSTEFEQARRWLRKFNPQTIGEYERALKVCATHQLKSERRELLRGYYLELLNAGQMELAEALRLAEPSLMATFPLTAEQQQVEHQLHLTRARLQQELATAEAESKATLVALDPAHQLKDAFQRNDLETGMRLCKRYQHLRAEILAELLRRTLAVSRQLNKVGRWLLLGNETTQDEIFRLALTRYGTKPPTVGRFFTGTLAQKQLVLTRCHEAMRTDTLRTAVEFALILGGDIAAMNCRRCLRRAEELATDRYGRAKLTNLRKLIAGRERPTTT